MRVSLNDLVQMLAARVGQQFDVPLMEQLKVILNYKRADWFQKVIDKHPDQRKFFLKDFSAELQEVEQAECPVELDCDVLRTVEKIPLPIRTGYALFDFVGSADKQEAYRYTTPDQAVIMNRYNKYTKDKPAYFYVNGYIYIYNDNDIEYINIRGIFPDQRELNTFKCEGTPCYTDDDQYDIPDDVINLIIQDTLKNELRASVLDTTQPIENAKDING